MLLSPKIVVPRASTKKQQICEALLEQIRSGELPVGARIPSAPELAGTWQVAYGTMHAALTELTRQGWLVRYPKFGTFVAAPPPGQGAGPAARTALIVIPPRADIVASGNGTEVFAMLHGLSEGASREGWHARMESLPTGAQVSEMESIVARMREASGAVFIGRQYALLVQRLEKAGFPVVSLGDDPGSGNVISYDRSVAVDLGVTHLCRQGRKRIAYFGNLNDPFGKHEAFQRTLEREGLENNPAWHIDTPSSDAALANLRQKLDQWQCDALYAVNYRMASCFVRQARERGLRVPQDVAVVANGIEENELTDVQISYVRVPYLEFGLEAARLLARNFEKSPLKKREINLLPPALVVRQSCGAAAPLP